MRPFEAGDVLRGPSPVGDPQKKRPLIIATDEDPADGTLIVCTSTDSSIWSDTTTQLKAGCHTLLDRDCSVIYGEAKVLTKAEADALRALVEARAFQFDPKDKLNPNDLRRVQQGFGTASGVPLEQRDLKPKVHEYAKKRGII